MDYLEKLKLICEEITKERSSRGYTDDPFMNLYQDFNEYAETMYNPFSCVHDLKQELAKRIVDILVKGATEDLLEDFLQFRECKTETTTSNLKKEWLLTQWWGYIHARRK